MASVSISAESCTAESGFTCTNCEDAIPLVNIFKCVTCSDTVIDPAQHLEVFCDGCVISHIKKNHKIADNRGFEPSVCKDHKQLCSEFCKTCEKLCCVKCLRDHIKHEVEPLKKKASEVRAKVFEALTQWELNEKPARAKKESVSATLASRREDAEKLIEYVENQIEEIKVKVVHEIRSKLTGMESSEKDVEAHIKDVVDLQQDLRNVLQSSEGAMIESFTESSAKIELCSNSHKKIEGLNFDGVSEIAETGSLDADFEKFLVEIKLQFEKACEAKKSVVLWNKCSRTAGSTKIKERFFFNLHDDDESAIEVEIKPKGYKIQKCFIDTGANIVNEKVITNQLGMNSDVEYVFCIYGWWILILFDDKSVIVLEPNDGKMANFDVHYPSMPYYLTPLIVGHKVEWVFWDAATKTLRSTIDQFQIPCDSKPNNMLDSFIEDFFVFFEASKKDVIVLLRHKLAPVSVKVIPFPVHQLNVVDCISCREFYSLSLAGVYLIMWSKESNISKILRDDISKWVVEENIILNAAQTCFTRTLKRYLIPKIYCTSEKISLDVFAIRKPPMQSPIFSDSSDDSFTDSF